MHIDESRLITPYNDKADQLGNINNPNMKPIITPETENQLRAQGATEEQINQIKTGNFGQIECYSVLSGETPMLIDMQMTNIQNIFKIQAGMELPVYALATDTDESGNKRIKVAESRIISVPQEIYLTDMVDLVFSNGFHFGCAPSTLILLASGSFIPAGDLTVDDPVNPPIILGVTFRPDLGFRFDNFYLTKKTSLSVMAQPGYVFVALHGNILLPKINEDKGEISFICVAQ